MLVCDEKSIQIFGYSMEEYQPYPIVSYNVNQTTNEAAPAELGARHLPGSQASLVEEVKESSSHLGGRQRRIESVEDENEQSCSSLYI